MATAINPITGNLIKTKGANDKYRSGFDGIDWSVKSDTQEQAPKFHLKQYGDVTQAEMDEYVNTGKIASRQ